MYREYYSLTRRPFEMSPDPYFYFPTPLHNEAMATLYCGVQMRKGLVVDTVHQFSQGIPRLVNTLCENALISGFARRAKQVQPRMIQEVAGDLRLELSPTTPAPTAMHLEEENEVLELMMRKMEPWYGTLEQATANLDIEARIKPR
jgi:hypothetical protein